MSHWWVTDESRAGMTSKPMSQRLHQGHDDKVDEHDDEDVDWNEQYVDDDTNIAAQVSEECDEQNCDENASKDEDVTG